MRKLKDILKNKYYHLLIETNIENLEFPFINDYIIVTSTFQINCELIGYSIKN